MNSLVMPTGHFDLSMIEQTPNQAIEIAKRMGMTSVIVPFLNLDDRPADAKGWQKFSDQLSEVAKPILDAG